MSDYLRDQYRKLHKSKMGYGPGPKDKEVAVLRKIVVECNLKHAKRVLDWGCGNSMLGAALWPSPDTVNVLYDFAIPGRDDRPEGEFDVVLCTDVMEHIPEKEVDAVLDELFNYAPVAIFVIHTGEAFNKLPDGTNCHCTVKPSGWWVSKLLEHWNVATTFDVGRAPTFGVVVSE